MSSEEIREYALSKDEADESFTFGEDTLVFKVKGKIFLLLSLSSTPTQFNVKCDPEKALELREQYVCVKPGYHMNKKHWNTVIMDGTLPKGMIFEMIGHSYTLVSGRK